MEIGFGQFLFGNYRGLRLNRAYLDDLIAIS
jgi:hypothetical protein